MQRVLYGLVFSSLFLCTFALDAAAKPASYSFPYYSMPIYQNRVKAQHQAALEKELEKQLQTRQALTRQLSREVALSDVSLSRVKQLLRQGADPAPVLPLAVKRNHPQVLESFYKVKKDRDWSSSEEKAVRLAMQRGAFQSFAVLVDKGVSCPHTYALNWSDASSYWRPMQPEIIEKLVKDCFRDQAQRDQFLNMALIRLSHGKNNLFMISQNVNRFVKPEQQAAWLANIAVAVKAGARVQDDTLFKTVAESRVRTADKQTDLSFATTRQLVRLGLQGGANGPRVLKQLNNSRGEGWRYYSWYERNRLSNLLEGKPENESRSLADSVNMGMRNLTKGII